MDAITVVTLSTLLWKLVAFVKNILNFQTGVKNNKAYWDPILTQLLAWIFGFLLVWIATQANVASSIKIWGTTLDQLNSGSLLLLGLALSSFGGAAVEVKKALDNNDSAKQPSLITEESVAPKR